MPTLAQFFIERLKKLADHGFGLPGDYVLNFYRQLSKSLDMVNVTDEQSAGFAADAYARVNGFGFVCVTYCVGGFKVINPTAGAKSEESPVLIISGAPGVQEREAGLMLHHAAGPYECQHEMYKRICCATAVLDDPAKACYEIDRVLSAIRYHKQPGYIELPRDMVEKNVKYDVYGMGNPKVSVSDEENIEEAIDKSLEFINVSERPIILAGVETARFGLGLPLLQFAEKHNIPIATTLLGKSVISETHPLSLGVYCGGMSRPEVSKVVEKSDCLIMLGVMQTDMNMGFAPLRCNRTNVIQAHTGRVRIRRSTYENVPFFTFAEGLLKASIAPKAAISLPPKMIAEFVPCPDKVITVSRFFDKVNSIISKDHAIIADVGDSLFGAADMMVHHRNQFLAPAFYTSMGNSVPGALGVQTALPDVRPIVIVGDGAFQMTGMETSTIVRRGLNPIIFVLNNQGYGTERQLGHDGDFNDIQVWRYDKIPDIIGGGTGFMVETEEDLERAIENSMSNKSLSIVNVILDKMDATPALKRMTESLSKRV